MRLNLWQQCLTTLEDKYPAHQFNTWIRPLRADIQPDKFILLAPNRFVVDWVKQHFFDSIEEAVVALSKGRYHCISLEISKGQTATLRPAKEGPSIESLVVTKRKNQTNVSVLKNNINPAFTFDNFVEGNSNQLARAAALQVAEHPGDAYNPLFIYGGVGLGKTHLMYAVGNSILSKKSSANVLYLHSERFVSDMVKALQTNTINNFKQLYRSLDALLIDDIQFFAGKDRSQEEFFHTFNALLEGQQQVILTSDRYPKEIEGVEERLRSRFGWGLTVAVEPPELETRVAILMRKAEQNNIELSDEVAFFIAKRIRSNVRELEGALRRVMANAHFTGKAITVEFVHDALRDLLALHDKLVTVDNIIKTVASYYKIKVADLLSKKRNRSIARPRQIAMALAKELTSHSLPEIGEAFSGRDHTTVLHACRKVKALMKKERDLADDYNNLMRALST